jgi:hypothetical protein
MTNGRMRTRLALLFATTAVWWLAGGCCGGGSATDAGMDSGADTDTDTGTGSDAGLDAGADGSGGTDTEIACTVTVGPPQDQILLEGTCQPGPDGCTGGYDPNQQSGTCATTETCCIGPDQCAKQMPDGQCAATEQECPGTAPTQGYPEIGCPSDTPVCCFFAPPGDGGPADGGPDGGGNYTLEQAISDKAQSTTLAFAGLAMMTGNLEAQSFFPPGKVADYTGFQYLRDNDPDEMGHNTDFLTRVAYNVIYLLDDAQFADLKELATSQIAQIEEYGYKRFSLMKAFRRVLEGDIPSGSTGLNLDAVKQASHELYLIDGQISFDRALMYANILASMDSSQKSYLEDMKGEGWASWPDITADQVKARMSGLPQGEAVAVMTYAGDLFSWYAGSVDADVYFCPERHGTYYGSFYMKDAPAMGHPEYTIDEALTGEAGAALVDSALGYVSAQQAATIAGLVDIQRDNLYAGTTSIVGVRTEIADLLRGLMTSTANSDEVETQVLDLSGTYGDLDGEDNTNYANVFAQVYATMDADQKTKLYDLRHSIMSGTYSDDTPFDYTDCTTFYLYSSEIEDTSVLDQYIDDTDYLFFAP